MKIYKIDKPLANLTQGCRDSIQTKKIIIWKGINTTETEENEKSLDPTIKPILNQTGKSRWNG